MKPGQRRSVKFKENAQYRDGRISGFALASDVHFESAHIGLRQGARSLPGRGGKEPFRDAPGSNFWLNPLSECQKPIPASEVELLLSGKIFEVIKAAG